MTKNTSSSGRRKLLKSLAAGGGVWTTSKVLPESWQKPVVDSIILPAHAGFSPKT
jgi:hypothetical protein